MLLLLGAPGELIAIEEACRASLGPFERCRIACMGNALEAAAPREETCMDVATIFGPRDDGAGGCDIPSIDRKDPIIPVGLVDSSATG